MTEQKDKKDHHSGRILAIDHGQSRIGLAISDPLHIIAQGLKTIICDRSDSHFSLIATIVSKQNVSLIIIGMPYRMSGIEGTTAKRVREFADKLKNYVSVPIEFIDERLTSVQAKRALVEMGYKTGDKKEKVDQTAAIFLLQTYLDIMSG